MKTFAYHSAQARCYPVSPVGLAKVAYLGPLCNGAFKAFAPQVRCATSKARAILIKMDGCLMLMSGLPDAPDKGSLADSPPGCLIVRPDQLSFWSAYAERMAYAGLRRLVFLESQTPLALQWLERRSSLLAQPEL